MTLFIPPILGEAPNQRWGVCTICRHYGRDTRFRLPEQAAAYERHFHACSDEHMDELRATETLAGKAPGLFDPKVSGDVELQRWIDKHRGQLLEGRKKL